MIKIIKDNCILCNKSFWWNEVVIWKLPENVWFCKNCITKFKDDNTYKWINAWITQEYAPLIEFEYNE